MKSQVSRLDPKSQPEVNLGAAKFRGETLECLQLSSRWLRILCDIETTFEFGGRPHIMAILQIQRLMESESPYRLTPVVSIAVFCVAFASILYIQTSQ